MHVAVASLYLNLCSTYHAFLNDDYEDKIKSETNLNEMLEKKEIDADQHRILKGFLRHVNFVYAEPSEMDKLAVARAYYAYYMGTLI